METKGYKLPVISHGDKMFSLERTVDDTVVTLCGDRW